MLTLALPATQYKRMLHHSWDSPRNSHLDVPTLVITQAQSMYRELAPSEGQSQSRATIPACISNFLVFCYCNERVSLKIP